MTTVNVVVAGGTAWLDHPYGARLRFRRLCGISFAGECRGAATDVVEQDQASPAAPRAAAARLSSMRRGAPAVQPVAAEFSRLLPREPRRLPELRLDRPTLELAYGDRGGVGGDRRGRSGHPAYAPVGIDQTTATNPAMGRDRTLRSLNLIGYP